MINNSRMSAVLLTLVCLATSCGGSKENLPTIYPKTLHDPVEILFSDVDSLLSLDKGNFWGVELRGPILLVEPQTRIFYSNETYSTQSSLQTGFALRDTLPAEVPIANTAVDWNNRRWAMVMLPLPHDRTTANELLIHELFHRIQPELEFNGFQEVSNAHLDSYKGRMLLRLELEALKKALQSDNPRTALDHVRNALTFRKQRQETGEIKISENSLELNEGMAQYTAKMLGGRNQKELVSDLCSSIEKLEKSPSFVRSFAYYTIPMYGYILSLSNPNWHREINKSTVLTDYFENAFDLDPNSNQPLKNIIGNLDYSYNRILREETRREEIRKERIESLKAKFLENPTLKLPLQNIQISFDPGNLTPIEGVGTVYPNLKIVDHWGTLSVENDALMASDWSYIKVTSPTFDSESIVKGEGWILTLNEGWKVEKNMGEYKLARN